MLDQANDLRHLVTNRDGLPARRPAGRCRWIAVAGGKGGAGTTSVAIALTLADRKRKSLLIDADPRHSDAALRLGVEDHRTLGDLLAGRGLAEVVQTATNGVRLVPGRRDWDDLTGGSWAVVERIGEAVGRSDLDADVVVLDLGNSPDRTIAGLWQAADEAMIVTTPDIASIVGAYEALKVLTNRGAAAPPTSVVVTMAASSAAATTAYQRLAEAARRFLGLRLMGTVPPCAPGWGFGIKKEKTNLNFHSPAADIGRKLSVAGRLLNWRKRAKSRGTRESNLLPDSMSAASADWLF